MQQHEYSISSSLEKFSMDATNLRSLPHFNRFTTDCFHKQRWITFDRRVSNRDCNTPDIQLNSWVDQPGTAAQSNRPSGSSLLTPLSRALSSPDSSIDPLLQLQYTEGQAWKNAMHKFPRKQDKNHLTTGDALPPHRFLAHRPPCPPSVHVHFCASTP